MFTNTINWISRHPWRAAIGLTLATMLILISAGMVWGVQVASRAERLATELRATGSSAEAVLKEADSENIPEISASLDASIRSARELDDDLWPFRFAGAVVGWVPFLGDNLTAAPDIVERLNDDLVAAAALVDAAGLLVTTYGDLTDHNDGLVDMLPALPRESEIVEAARLIGEANQALSKAEEKASRVSDGRLFGKMGSESRELREQEIRLREVINWSALATDSLLALRKLGDASIPFIDLLDNGGPSEPTLDRNTFSAMQGLEAAASQAFIAVASTNAAAPDGIAESPVSAVLMDFEPVLSALADISRAGAITWDAVSPALVEMESSPGGLIGSGSSILLAVGRLDESRAKLEEARNILDSIVGDLRGVKLASPIAASTAQTLMEGAAEVARVVGFLSDFPGIGLDALGAAGPKRYLVLGQTSDELRGSGGFVSGAWVITFDSGQLTDFVYHDIVNVDDRSRLELHPLPPELLSLHMDAPVWMLRDATWSPEFPAAARTAAQIFELAQDGPPVDGVIAVTQWAIIGLAEALGTITTESGMISSDDLLPTLELGTDSEGRAYVNTVFSGVLDEFSAPMVNDRLFSLALAASELLDRRDVQVYMFEPEVQEIVVQAGWDGSIDTQVGDRLAVIDSNVGWSKVDRNIERSFEYDVVLSISEPMRAHLKVSYRNLSKIDARGCEIQAPIHALPYAELKQACYWNLIRVYGPVGGSMVDHDSLPIPDNSVIARLGAGIPGDDSVDVGIDTGGRFVSGLITVPPGQSVSAEFDFMVPETALMASGDELTYQLALTAQPGALGRDALVRIDMPAGYRLRASSQVPSWVEYGVVEFAMRLETDTTIELRLEPGPATAGYLPASRHGLAQTASLP